MDQDLEKDDLRERYSLADFDPARRIAQFRVPTTIPGETAFFYLRLPIKLASEKNVNDWLNQKGEESGYVDVDLKFKLLMKARLWRNRKKDFYNENKDNPHINPGIANDQETYYLRILAEQEEMTSQFKQPVSENP